MVLHRKKSRLKPQWQQKLSRKKQRQRKHLQKQKLKKQRRRKKYLQRLSRKKQQPKTKNLQKTERKKQRKKHLQKLKQAGLIVGRKDAQFVRYRLAGDEVVALFRALGIAGQAYLADVDRIVRTYLDAKDELEPVPAGDLLERARKGLVTVLDVRPPQEFAAGHVPGAVNIPVHELERRLAELPRRREVVAYCRGPFCLMSFDAVQLLRAKGLKARRLQDGMPEWQLAGLPTERS